MTFNNFYFLFWWVAILILLAGVRVIEKLSKRKYAIICKVNLLFFSFCFVGYANWHFTFILLGYIIFIYVVGLKIEPGRKAILRLGLVFSVGILIVFKFGSDQIILPLGMSYYIFSGISYLVDVYWKRIPSEKNFIDFALYLSFFPKIVAGPIVKGYDFLPKVKSYDGLCANDLLEGLQIFVFGLFKKVVLADHLAVFVNDVFYLPAAYNTQTVILAVVSYSLQIYFDFSGYSDMAIGVAKSLGIELPRNFDLPYLATNISDFWKRWHISLSSWFQEYVYIPLGGSRRGEGRTWCNLMIVMLISGLWHGNGWTFLVWGMLHGVLNSVYRLYKRLTKNKSNKFKNNPFVKSICIMCNFATVTLLWVFFRADSLQNAFSVIQGIFVRQDGINQMYSWSFIAIVCLIVSSIVAAMYSYKAGEQKVHGFYPIMNLSKLSSLTVFFVFVGITIIFGYFGNTAFIYGGF